VVNFTNKSNVTSSILHYVTREFGKVEKVTIIGRLVGVVIDTGTHREVWSLQRGGIYNDL